MAAPIGWESAKSKAYVHAEGAVTSSEGSDAAALAVTHFKRLDCNAAALPDGTVLVACRPKTGQRHQIRVHLEHIGWPIANDSLYGAFLPVNSDWSRSGETSHGNDLNEQSLIRFLCLI